MSRGGAIIVSVGDELLAGRVLDSNAHWLSGELRLAGFSVVRRVTVGDEIDEIARAVDAARTEAAVVVVGGGLGPTLDDLTRDGIARALAVALVRDESALAFVRGLYERRGRAMPAGSEVQADLPAGATMVPNSNGSAPGILLADDERVLFVAPGVPAEFRAMVTNSLLPLLATHRMRGPQPSVRRVTITGVPEVTIGQLLGPLMQRGRDPIIGSYPNLGRVVLVVESHAMDAAVAARQLAADVGEIHARLGDAVIADDDLGLNEVVGALLIERGVTIAVGESLTGGAIADGLVEIPGISAVFRGGFAPYHNDAKVAALGVSRALLDDPEQGAVSESCAAAMAEGARRITGAQIAVSATGIAGPGGGTDAKPVGLVCFAIADAHTTRTSSQRFSGDRMAVRRLARERAYDLIRRHVLGLPPTPSVFTRAIKPHP